MYKIPEEYKVNKNVAIKTFIASSHKPNEKKRLKESLLNATIEYQIKGEKIPSVITDECDCEVIIFIGIKVKNIKDANFVSETIQNMGKPFYILRIYDSLGNECYSFAHKRLNFEDRTQVVIENTVVSKITSNIFDDEVNRFISEYAGFDKIINKFNKFSMYIEIMVKTYMISNTYLWSKIETLLSSKLWYNTDEVIKVFLKLKRIEELKRLKKSAKTISDNSKINSELREIYSKLDKQTQTQEG